VSPARRVPLTRRARGNRNRSASLHSIPTATSLTGVPSENMTRKSHHLTSSARRFVTRACLHYLSSHAAEWALSLLILAGFLIAGCAASVYAEGPAPAAHRPAQHQPKQPKQPKAKHPHRAVDAYYTCLADPLQAPETCWALQQAAYDESHPTE
jgi:hypothetical protein